MNNSIIKSILFLASSFILTGLFATGNAIADELATDGQIYFVGKIAPLGGSSSSGKNAKGVYLRWDIVEGQMPADVARLTLKRDGVALLEKNVDQVMTSSEIEAIYADSSQSQRLLSTITLLKRYVLEKIKLVVGTGSSLQDFNASEFASTLETIIQDPEDRAWTYLASRINFNIARARFRAYIDPTIIDNATYSLIATSTSNEEALLGQITIDVDANRQLMPVVGFSQVENNACTVAESMQDHFTLVLDWDAAGKGRSDYNVTDATSNALQLAGYHLYRTRDDLAQEIDVAPVMDLASLAENTAHDQRGDVSTISSGGYVLERVNSQIIISEGTEQAPAENDESVSNNDRAFFETPAQLAMAGLKPGDRRAYYIVPVDYAGHFGETQAAIVRIPNKTPVATPWNLDFRIKGTAQPEAILQWDAINILNYTAFYENSWVVCNEENGLLEFAPKPSRCDKPNHVRIDVDQYLVYRFSTSTQAINFQDADGDGVSDSDERAFSEANKTPECNANSTTSNADNYLVASSNFERQTLDSGRIIVSFSDPYLLSTNKIGKTFYYRIASKTSDGRVSFLTSPIKGVYHDIFSINKPTVTSNMVGNCCEVELDTKDQVWGFSDTIGAHNTISLATPDAPILPGNPSQAFSISEFSDENGFLCSDQNSPIKSYWGSGAGKQKQIIYPGISSSSNEAAYCKASLPQDMNLCETEKWRIVERACDKTVEDGQTIDPNSSVTHIIEGEPGTCQKVMLEIDGARTEVASSCGTNSPTVLEFESQPGECGYAQSIDASGNVSPWAALPCNVASSNSPPNPPQIISFEANASDVTYSWRLPMDPVAVTLIEITSIDETDSQLLSVANGGFEPGRVFEPQSTTIHELLGVRDHWCIRMKAIAPTTSEGVAPLSSNWSNKICRFRRANNNSMTQYLPWPEHKAKNVKLNLAVIKTADLVDETVGMSFEKMPMMINFGIRNLTNCTIHTQTINSTNEAPKPLIFGREPTCWSIADTNSAGLSFNIPFIVYRQAQTASGDKGQWIQVSPLIDKIHWHNFKTSKGPTWELIDPYFRFYRTSYANNLPWNLAFIDRYPYIAGYQYRYQMVSFSPQHSVSNIRQSDWVQTDELLRSSTSHQGVQ